MIMENQPYAEYECQECGNVIRFMGDQNDPPQSMQSVCLVCCPTTAGSGTKTREFQLIQVMV